MEGKEIKLKYPITVNGVKTGLLHVGRIKVKHLKTLSGTLVTDIASGQISNDTIIKLIPVFAGITGMTEEEAGEIDLSDLMTIVEAMTGAMGN